MKPEPFFEVSKVSEIVEIKPGVGGMSSILINGVECGKWFKCDDGSSSVMCLFPTPRRDLKPCPTAEEAVMHVIKELSWFTRNLGVVGQRVYHGEPVYVATHLYLNTGWFRQIPQGGHFWDFRAGVWQHTGSVVAMDRRGGLNWSGCSPLLVLARPDLKDDVIERSTYND